MQRLHRRRRSGRRHSISKTVHACCGSTGGGYDPVVTRAEKNVCANILEVLRTARRFSLREATVLHCWLQLPAMVKMACASPAPLSCHKRPNNHRSILFDQAV